MTRMGDKSATLAIARMTRWSGERVIARILFSATVLALLAFGFAPWQQNTRAKGSVIAYSANERALTVEAPVNGRVVQWRFNEGDRVDAGDVIVELADNDPNAVARYRSERDAIKASIEAIRGSMDALEARLASLREAREMALAAIRAEISVAASDLESEKMALAAADAKLRAARIQFDRVSVLESDGLSSERDLELAERNAAQAIAAKEAARASVEAARSMVEAKQSARAGTAFELDAKIAKARDGFESARNELAKARKNLAATERALARQNSLEVTAPRAGMLTEVVAREGSAFVKQGEKLAVVVPEAVRRAVELFVEGNDAPLVVPGQEVQIQFEGWPAIQFGGWPRAAVGTFEGEVSFVEANATPRGRFRVVVLPDDEASWPNDDVLRQGNSVNGWILLNRVSLGYELWRQLNGFPPDLPAAAAERSGFAPKD